MTNVKMSESEVERMMFGMGHPGVCLACGDVDEYAGCEPDAREYKCPACGEFKLYGLEEALSMGAIELT